MSTRWRKKGLAIILGTVMVLAAGMPAAAQDEDLLTDLAEETLGDTAELPEEEPQENPQENPSDTVLDTEAADLSNEGEDAGSSEIMDPLESEDLAAGEETIPEDMDTAGLGDLLIEDPETASEEEELQALSSFSEYFEETWDVVDVEYENNLVLEGPDGASAYQWYDLLSEICITVDGYGDQAGLNSVSDEETIISGATGSTYAPAFGSQEQIHYYGCVTDGGDSVIYQVYRPQTYVDQTPYVDAVIGSASSVTIHPHLYYDGPDSYPYASFRLRPTKTGIYRFVSHDGYAAEALGAYTDPVAYLYDEDEDLIDIFDEGETDNDGNFEFTYGLVGGKTYYLDLGYYDFGGGLEDDYYCNAYGTYPVSINFVKGISFSDYFQGSWTVKGAGCENSTFLLVAPDSSGLYQWYDLGTEITTLSDGSGYDSVSDDTTAISGANEYAYRSTWKSGELIHYYGCETADGARAVYEVLKIFDVNSYLIIPLSGSGTISRNSICLESLGKSNTFQLKPAVSGKCTIRSLDPYANDYDDFYADPLITVTDTRGYRVAADDDGGTGRNFITSFNVTAGATYYAKPTYASYSDYVVYGAYPFQIIFSANSPAVTPGRAPAAPAEQITISKKPAFVKVKAQKKGKAVLSWKHFKLSKKNKAIWKKIKKVEVQYSSSSSFPAGSTTTKLLSKKKTKLTVSKLKANTTYYFRVRYVESTGKVSAWSSTKKVKAKK